MADRIYGHFLTKVLPGLKEAACYYADRIKDKAPYFYKELHRYCTYLSSAIKELKEKEESLDFSFGFAEEPIFVDNNGNHYSLIQIIRGEIPREVLNSGSLRLDKERIDSILVKNGLNRIVEKTPPYIQDVTNYPFLPSTWYISTGYGKIEIDFPDFTVHVYLKDTGWHSRKRVSVCIYDKGDTKKRCGLYYALKTLGEAYYLMKNYPLIQHISKTIILGNSYKKGEYLPNLKARSGIYMCEPASPEEFFDRLHDSVTTYRGCVFTGLFGEETCEELFVQKAMQLPLCVTSKDGMIVRFNLLKMTPESQSYRAVGFRKGNQALFYDGGYSLWNDITLSEEAMKRIPK